MDEPAADTFVVAPPPVIEEDKANPPPLPPRPADQEGDVATGVDDLKKEPENVVADPAPISAPPAQKEEEIEAKGETLEAFGELSKDKEERTNPIRKRRRMSVVDALAKNYMDEREVTSVEVCEPIQKADRMVKWTEYKIKVAYENGDVAEVQRRYKHFNWLRNQLVQEHRGVIIPPLPEKNYLNRFDEQFIENRRGRLQQFLGRVLRKQALKFDNAFVLFLRATSEQFAKVFKGNSATTSERASGLYNSYRMGKVTIKASMNKENVKVTPDDLKCASLRELGGHLDAITSALAKALVHMDDKQVSIHDLCGTISNHLSQINPNIVTIIKSSTDVEIESFSMLVGKFQDLMSELSQVKEHTDRAYISELATPDGPTQVFLRDIFEDLSRYGKAIVQCMDGRKQTWLQCEAEKNTLLSRQQTLAGLKNSSSSYVYRKESRIEKTTALIENSVEVVQSWEDELHKVTIAATKEVEEYTSTLEDSLRGGLRTFADLEIERLEKQLNLWKDFRADL